MLLKEYKSIVKTENGYIIHADAADLMLVFLKEDVIRRRKTSSVSAFRLTEHFRKRPTRL